MLAQLAAQNTVLHVDARCAEKQFRKTVARAIAAGDRHSVAVNINGTVTCWGSNSNGQCSVPSGLTDVVSVAAGDDFSVALTNTGEVH